MHNLTRVDKMRHAKKAWLSEREDFVFCDACKVDSRKERRPGAVSA
jgi:hypothetical protein